MDLSLREAVGLRAPGNGFVEYDIQFLASCLEFGGPALVHAPDFLDDGTCPNAGEVP